MAFSSIIAARSLSRLFLPVLGYFSSFSKKPPSERRITMGRAGMNRSRLIIQGAAETHSLSQKVLVRKCLIHNRNREKRIVRGRRSRGTGRNTEKTDCQRTDAKAPSATKKNAKSILCLV